MGFGIAVFIALKSIYACFYRMFATNAKFCVTIVKLSDRCVRRLSILKQNCFLLAFKHFKNDLHWLPVSLSPFRDVPADTQIEIDGDRETERIYSLFTINMSKLQKLEGTQIIRRIILILFGSNSLGP